MESRDPAPDDTPGRRTRARRTSLHLDASKFRLGADADAPRSPLSPPSPRSPPAAALAAAAAGAPGRPRALTQGAPAVPAAAGPSASHGRHRAATVANPPKSAPPGSAVPEKEKRKRSRVTPEQLTHLERIFAADKSPTAAKRKEISEMLGMQERQTQIWFQNRRAKAKTLEGKGKAGFRGSPTSGGDSPPDTPPDFAPDVDLQSLIHEDEPVGFIPCSDLSIGSWRRISATLGQHDLLAYTSAAKRCLTWFIFSNGYGFKMEIPFDSITTTSFSGTSQGQGLASFFLARPPLFYLESTASPPGAPGPAKLWKKCADWTEGQQATKVLRHDLVGAALPLLNALKALPGSEHLAGVGGAYGAPDIVLPHSPMAGLDAPPGFAAGALSQYLHGRKRSFSGPPALAQTARDVPAYGLLGGPLAGPLGGSLAGPLGGAQAGASETQFPAPYSEQRATALSFPPEYSPSLFRAFPAPPHASLGDFSTVPIAHAAARPYSAPSVDARFPFEPPPAPFGTASPTLLTSAFDPARLHRPVQLADPAGFADDTGQPSGDPPFDAASLGMASHHDPSQPAP